MPISGKMFIGGPTSMAGPGGASGSIQYNNSGSFGGFGNWSGTTATLPALTVTNNALVSGTLTVTGHVTLEGITSTGATGTGLLVFGNTPTLIAPILGTPTSGTLTNCTLPVGGITGLGTGVATFLATPSSANLAAAVTDETGSGALVFGTSPTLTTPVLGVASYTSLAGGAIVQTVSSANALAVGPSGTTNPTLNIVTNTASGITGLSITNAASGGGIKLASLGGTNEDINIVPKGSGSLLVTTQGGGQFSIAGSNGNMTTGGSIYWAAGAYSGANGRSLLNSPSDGVWTMVNNNANDFNRLQFGGTTSSFPSLKRSTTTLQVRLADDSAYATLDAGAYKVGGVAGVDFGPGLPTSITVVKGIITAIS